VGIETVTERAYQGLSNKPGLGRECGWRDTVRKPGIGIGKK